MNTLRKNKRDIMKRRGLSISGFALGAVNWRGLLNLAAAGLISLCAAGIARADETLYARKRTDAKVLQPWGHRRMPRFAGATKSDYPHS